MTSNFKSLFGVALNAQLMSRGISQSVLAARLGVSRSYINKAMHGYTSVSPALVDTVGSVIGTSAEEFVELSRGAAQDAGWTLDLSVPKKPG